MREGDETTSQVVFMVIILHILSTVGGYLIPIVCSQDELVPSGCHIVL